MSDATDSADGFPVQVVVEAFRANVEGEPRSVGVFTTASDKLSALPYTTLNAVQSFILDDLMLHARSVVLDVDQSKTFVVCDGVMLPSSQYLTERGWGQDDRAERAHAMVFDEDEEMDEEDDEDEEDEEEEDDEE